MNRRRDFGFEDSRPANRYRNFNSTRSSSRERSPLLRHGVDQMCPTRDPNTVSARIYVGSMMPEITQDALYNHFSRWGHVITAVTKKNRRFAYVQFKNEADAQACLANGPFTMVDGFRLDVEPAKNGPTFLGGVGRNRSSFKKDFPTQRENRGSQAPKRYADADRHLPSEFKEDAYSDDPYRKSSMVRDRHSESINHRDSWDRPSRDPYLGDSEQPPSIYASETSNFRGQEDDLGSPSKPRLVYDSSSPDPIDITCTNDVEIVVPNTMQRAYAENLESQLKDFNLTVGFLFPPPEISSERVIQELSARNCLYVIFTTEENEKHKSLTLKILHGEPQEHLNMPVEDAMRLIQQNFNKYSKKNRLRSMQDVVPRDIRNLLLKLLEMRPLSMVDLDKMIKYLRERQNALLDDQIEQKRETIIGQQNQAAIAAVTQSMTVTYPGYNYIATPGVTYPTTPASIVTSLPPEIMSASNMSVAYPTAYSTGITGVSINQGMTVATPPGLSAASLQAPITGIMSGYKRQQPHMITQNRYAPLSLSNSAVNNKQSELQDKILSILQSQDGHGNAFQVPQAVPPPVTEVPAPIAVEQKKIWSSRQRDPQQGAAAPPLLAPAAAAHRRARDRSHSRGRTTRLNPQRRESLRESMKDSRNQGPTQPLPPQMHNFPLVGHSAPPQQGGYWMGPNQPQVRSPSFKGHHQELLAAPGPSSRHQGNVVRASSRTRRKDQPNRGYGHLKTSCA